MIIHHRTRHVRIEDQYGDKYIMTTDGKKQPPPLITTLNSQGNDRLTEEKDNHGEDETRDTTEGRDTNAREDYCKQKGAL